MQKFKSIKSNIALLQINNIDTDMIIPKQFLKTIKRYGLGSKLFFEMRYKNNDINDLNFDFVLNRNEFKNTQILLCGKNFGCGSSREHAPWALLDFGIKSIIAESFADIFYNNCFENGILPIILSKDKIELIINNSKITDIFEIDLEKQIIKNEEISLNFDIDSFKKEKLLQGLDSIGITELMKNKIDQFENNQRLKNPWL